MYTGNPTPLESIVKYGPAPVALTASAVLQPGQQVKISGNGTVAPAVGLDIAIGHSAYHAKSGEKVTVVHKFSGIHNAIGATGELVAGSYAKPTGAMDATTKFPIFEPEAADTTGFIVVSGGAIGAKVLIGVL